MYELEAGFEKLILVCLNERTDGRASCGPRGSSRVHATLKQWVKSHGLARRVRVSKAGCLDHCAHGVTVLVLPEYRWYGGVSTADIDQIIAEHLSGMIPSSADSIKDES